MTLTDQATLLLNSDGLERLLVGVGVMAILWFGAAGIGIAWAWWISR